LKIRFAPLETINKEKTVRQRKPIGDKPEAVENTLCAPRNHQQRKDSKTKKTNRGQA